jgi:hypothetical protein
MGAMQNQMPTHVAKIETLCARWAQKACRSHALLQLRSVPELISISRCPMTNALIVHFIDFTGNKLSRRRGRHQKRNSFKTDPFDSPLCVKEGAPENSDAKMKILLRDCASYGQIMCPQRFLLPQNNLVTKISLDSSETQVYDCSKLDLYTASVKRPQVDQLKWLSKIFNQ